MERLAGITTFDNSLELVRDGRDVILNMGDKQLGFATYCHDSKNPSKSCFIANANQMNPGWASVTVSEFRKLRDALSFIEREGVAL